MPAEALVTQKKLSFKDIYDQSAEMVLNLAFRMVGKKEVARDLMQDVFVKVYENLDHFREDSKASTWVYRIAMNHIINYIKKEKRYLFMDLLDKNYNQNINESSYWEDNISEQADKQFEEKEKELFIRKKIEELNPKYRIPLLLYRYEEMSYQEIAEYLDLSLSAVEARIHRARKKLKEKLLPWIKFF